MILLLFLFCADSLPPLPDLTQIVFPEPPLWLEEEENSIVLTGYAGNFYGGRCDLSLENLNASLLYDQRTDWDSVKLAELSLFYSLPLPHFWLKPSVDGRMLLRNNRYYLLSPKLDFSSTVPWAIIFGTINADLWTINEVYHAEEATRIGIIFDRVVYLPHLEIAGVYTDEKLKSDFTGKLHIRNLHLAISSPIFYSFPSPNLIIQYLDLKVKVDVGIKSGVVYRRLSDFFDPEIPLDYRVPVPDESLKISVSFNSKLDFQQHWCSIHCSYKNWFDRLTAGNDFQITTTQDIQEVNVVFKFKNNFKLENLKINNVLNILYNWTDKNLPFLPQYAIYDTFDITYSLLEIMLDLRYLHEREGFAGKLPAAFIINPIIGLRYKFIKMFLSINNALGENQEIFDNRFLDYRQFAGGLEFIFRL